MGYSNRLCRTEGDRVTGVFGESDKLTGLVRLKGIG